MNLKEGRSWTIKIWGLEDDLGLNSFYEVPELWVADFQEACKYWKTPQQRCVDEGSSYFEWF